MAHLVPSRAAALIAVAAASALLATACGDDSDVPTEAGTFPLLGTEGDVPERPALAVKIDGTEAGRPQLGLGEADVVYEELVEGGLTRHLAVYHSEDPEIVGPVRSARSTDVELLPELGQPLFAWSGANPTFAALVEDADIIDVGMAAAPDAYERNPDRSSPYNLDADPELLREAAEGQSTEEPPLPLFDYRDEDEPLDSPGAEDSDAVQLQGGGLAITIEWTWNDDTELWERTQDGTPHEDSDGERITAANVVVRATPYEDTGIRDSSGAMVPVAIVEGEGDLLLLSDGQVQRGRWRQPSAGDPTTYTDQDGEPLRLTPGQTWIEVLPPGVID